jgi:CheY-like chemotaxis protein
MMDQVLIIDDDDLVVDLLKVIFTSFGYEVTTAHDGKEGVELFNSSSNFDMIFTDITMPGMDGNEVARSIRGSDKADVPIIAMSGYDDKADNELFTLSLQKPFNVQALKDVIKSIEGYRQVIQT